MRLNSVIAAFTLAAFSHVAVAQLQPPVNRTVGAQTQVFWTVNPNSAHPTWTLFLMDPAYIWGLYAILGRKIDNSLGYTNITLPATLDPSEDYVLKAVDDDNVDWVLQTSPIFHITA